MIVDTSPTQRVGQRSFEAQVGARGVDAALRDDGERARRVVQEVRQGHPRRAAEKQPEEPAAGEEARRTRRHAREEGRPAKRGPDRLQSRSVGAYCRHQKARSKHPLIAYFCIVFLVFPDHLIKLTTTTKTNRTCLIPRTVPSRTCNTNWRAYAKRTTTCCAHTRPSLYNSAYRSKRWASSRWRAQSVATSSSSAKAHPDCCQRHDLFCHHHHHHHYQQIIIAFFITIIIYITCICISPFYFISVHSSFKCPHPSFGLLFCCCLFFFYHKRTRKDSEK